MMKWSSFAPPNWQARQQSSNQSLGFVSLEYLVTLVGCRNRTGNGVL
jgi:hypothetical protein